MNLLQKLPIGLGLACLMMMSSCSKEEAQTPQPVKSERMDANMRGVPIAIPKYLPLTDGPTCDSCLPSGWEISGYSPGYATSSLVAFAGNPSTKWYQPLPTPSTGPGSIITLVNKDYAYSAGANATIKHLIKGKKYKITLSLSTTSLAGANGSYIPAVHLNVVDTPFPSSHLAYKKVDFAGKQNQWLTETIEFTAMSSEENFSIDCDGGSGKIDVTYTNIHVGPNAVQQIN